jgi:hypothetical protein
LDTTVSRAHISHGRKVFEVGVGEKLFSPPFLFGRKEKEAKEKA